MSRSNHPIEQEELMAYLDGELATSRAVEAATHLEYCAECQEFAAELRKISEELMVWEVEEIESEEGMPGVVKAALQDRPGKPRKKLEHHGWRALFTTRRLVWGAGSAVALFLFISLFSFSRLRPTYPTKAFSGPIQSEKQIERAKPQPPPPAATPIPRASGTSDWGTTSFYYDSAGLLAKLSPGAVADGYITSGTDVTKSARPENETEDVDDSRNPLPEIPLIARTVGLMLVTKEFEKTRAEIDRILKQHNGYFGEMNVSAPAEAGRTLTATLRVPAPQLESALSEMKKLGRVENESQGGEEVTQQYVDLEARLANAKHTEQRLTEILRQRTGKLQDVLKVELEIDRVRGEIEQMQAEKKELTKRVAFATLTATIKEEYEAKLQATPPSTGSRFRNAAVDGYNTVVEGLISVGLFLLSAGPSLLIWAAILFFPARLAWKRWKKAHPPRADADGE